MNHVMYHDMQIKTSTSVMKIFTPFFYFHLLAFILMLTYYRVYDQRLAASLINLPYPAENYSMSEKLSSRRR